LFDRIGGIYNYSPDIYMHSILNQAHPTEEHSKSKRAILVGSSAFMLIGMAAAFGTVTESDTYQGQFKDLLEQVAIPVATHISPDVTSNTREVIIQRGDTVTSLLSGMGIHDDGALAFLASNNKADVIFRQLAPGKTITASITEEGSLQSLVFPLNGDGDNAVLIERTTEGFSAQTHALPIGRRILLQTATIRHSLFGAADDAGIPDSVAIELANIFGGDIDFHRDLRKGGRFSVIYEASDYLGKPSHTQHILAAELSNDGKTYRAFWYEDSQGKGGYYTSEGKSVKKAFLRSPLEFSRITSGFSNARYHPVLREVRAHRGIDYGAPTGARVKVTGDGVIDFSGSKGGYGNVVIVRHPGDKSTVYGHLSRFADGIRKGTRVSQGDIIGYVGATGPHLHYEFRIAGIHRNPLTITLPTADPLPQSQLTTFHTNVETLMAQIASIRDMQLVQLD
jgi:murein DD-endopeptidase MepM/ murein hydrolase activator NlpD